MRISRLLKDLEVSALDPLQRVLLVTDGTLTEILEAVFLEPIELVKISQKNVATNVYHAPLDPKLGESIIERKIVLRGGQSGTHYVYAESVIAADRLSPAFRKGLVESDLPVGRLWIEHKLETFKEFLEVRFGADADLPADFTCDRSSVFVRRYRVFSGGMPIMLITEHFPGSFREPAIDWPEAGRPK